MKFANILFCANVSKNQLGALNWVQNKLSCKLFDAVKILKQYPKLESLSYSQLENINELFTNNKFTKTIIVSHPWVLTLKEDQVKFKIVENKYHKVTHDDLPLLNTPNSNYQKVVDKWMIEDAKFIGKCKNRVYYFSENLYCKPCDILNLMYHHKSLITFDIQKIISIMTLLKDSRVDPKLILEDFGIFGYDEKKLHERIEHCKYINVTPKPWMLRCSESKFTAHILKKEPDQRVFSKYETTVELLASELDRSKKDIEMYLFEGSVYNRSAAKYSAMLTLLTRKGFSKQEIWQNFAIFRLSLKTIDKRFNTFQNSGISPSLVDLFDSDEIIQGKINKLK